MKDDRLRIPVAMDYLPSLGLALFAFARTEWQAVHICEKKQKGYANQVVGKKDLNDDSSRSDPNAL
jgi:hypothetical protein